MTLTVNPSVLRLAASFCRPRFWLPGMVDFWPLGGSAMNIAGLGTEGFRLKLRVMSDDDLWWLFLDRREECSHEFWEEVETRRAAGTLSKNSPFWSMGELARYRQTRGSGRNSNLIELTRQEWEAHKHRKMSRMTSARW